MKGKIIGMPEVAEKFGVTPDKVGDVLALMGDSSDNVPGAPGIGPKTAAELITTYGDLETLLARAGEIKQPKRREAIINNADLIRLSRQLVALDEQTPLPLPLEQITPPQTDKTALLDWLQQQGFKALVTRMGGAPSMSPPASRSSAPSPASGRGEEGAAVVPSPACGGGLGRGHAAQLPFGPYACVTTLDQLKDWVARAFAAGVIAIDTETDSLTPSTTTLVGISLAVAPGAACYIPLNHRSEGLLSAGPLQQVPLAEAIAALKPLLADRSVLKIGQNMKFDWQVFAQHGVERCAL
jgi:DNA polymerase-1